MTRQLAGASLEVRAPATRTSKLAPGPQVTVLGPTKEASRASLCDAEGRRGGPRPVRPNEALLEGRSSRFGGAHGVDPAPSGADLNQIHFPGIRACSGLGLRAERSTPSVLKMAASRQRQGFGWRYSEPISRASQ